MKKTILAIGLTLFATSAHAGQTQWVEVAPDTRLRMIFSDSLSADNYTMMAMELEMPVGTKTYWRVPGETGIPLTIDSSNSKGVGESQIIWPYPKRVVTYGYVDYVYNRELVLPMKTQITGDNPRLEMSLVLGVCSDVCVPVNVNIDYDFSFAKRDSSASLRISQTLSNTPIAWDGPENPFGVAFYDETAEQFRLELLDQNLDIQSMIATIDESYVMFDAPQKSPIGNIVTFDKLGGGNIAQMVGQDLTITFMSPDGPYEISMPLVLSE